MQEAPKCSQGAIFSCSGYPLSQLPLQPPMLSPKHENNKDDIPLVTKELIYSECPVDDSDYSDAGDHLHQEGVALQRQQTGLQVQQNWIVELAVNKIRASFPSLIYVPLMGTLWANTVLFGPLRA